jgi:hypothetical protein
MMDINDPMAVRDMGERTLKSHQFYAYGLADALRAAADAIEQHGQFAISDITTWYDHDFGYWYVTIYRAIGPEDNDE